MLDMLPSYPELLGILVGQVSDQLSHQSYERLLCSVDALPMAIGVSLRSKIPLVYCQGSSLPPVLDFIGAYDVGHPTCFITNTTLLPNFENLLERASRVGLDVQYVITLFDFKNIRLSNLEINGLLSFDELLEQSSLPNTHLKKVRNWIETNHPIAGQP